MQGTHFFFYNNKNILHFTELLKRLNSEEYPFSKRLKLAETAFSSVDLPLVRKEDLLLEWLCKICATNQHAWKTLNNCLRSAHIDIKANVKQCLIDALELTLHTDVEDVYDEVLESCSLVLANNSMQQYFTNNPQSLGSLVKALLTNVLRHSTCTNASAEELDIIQHTRRKLTSVQTCTMVSVIESLMQIYKLSLSTRNELRLTFIRDILYPMCNLIDCRCMGSKTKLGVVAYICIQQLLLGKSKSVRHKSVESTGETAFSDLFSALLENVKALDLQSNILTYHFIFHAAIGTYKLDIVLLDIFFRNLVNSAGRYKLEILNVCLKLLNDVLLDFDNTVDGVTLSEYLQQFVTDILTCNLTRTQYEVLTQLAYVNPLLIERNLSDILDKILMDEQTAEYTNLLIAILHASTKLRREQGLIVQLLVSLKRHIATTKTCKIKAFLPHDFKTRLLKVIGNLSNSQAIAILRMLISYLNTDCVELLQCDTSCKSYFSSL